MSMHYWKALLAGLCLFALSSAHAAEKAKPKPTATAKAAGASYVLFGMSAKGALYFNQASVVRDGDSATGGFFWIWADGVDQHEGASANCRTDKLALIEKPVYGADGKLVVDSAALKYTHFRPTYYMETMHGLLCGKLKAIGTAKYATTAAIHKQALPAILKLAAAPPEKPIGPKYGIVGFGEATIFFADLNSRERNGDIVKMTALNVQGRDSWSPNGQYRHVLQYFEFDCKALTHSWSRIDAFGADGKLQATENSTEGWSQTQSGTVAGVMQLVGCMDPRDNFAKIYITTLEEAIRRGRIAWVDEQ